VGLVLLLVLRKLERALVPMTPIVLATGWSSLILYLIGIPLNPMSATLGTLVIAISTEFSVLLSERYARSAWPVTICAPPYPHLPLHRRCGHRLRRDGDRRFGC